MRLIRWSALLGAATLLLGLALFVIGMGQGEEPLRNTGVALWPFSVMFLIWAGLMRRVVSRTSTESGDT